MIEIRFVEIISFKAKFSSTETGFTGTRDLLEIEGFTGLEI